MREIFILGINNEKNLTRLFEEDASDPRTTSSAVLQIALAREFSLLDQTVRENMGSISIKAEPSEADHRNHVTGDCAYKNCVWYKCTVKGHLAPQCRKVTSNSSHNFLVKEETPDTLEDNDPVEGFFSIDEISTLIYDSNLNDKPIFTLLGNDLSLKDYVGVTFKQLGYLNLKITFQGNSCLLKIYVVRNGGPPLIGRNGLSLSNLGIRKLKNVNFLNSLVELQRVDILQKSYPDVFSGKMGIFDKLKVTLRLKNNAEPKFCKPKPVPFSLKGKIEKELEREVSCGVLMSTNFSEWGSPIVPVLKPNGDIRICGDFKV
nr:unnamed protein product [Callosobruchus chinensis]